MGFEIKNSDRAKETMLTMGGQVLTFSYLPNSYTPALMSKLADVRAMEVPPPELLIELTVQSLETMLVKWDANAGGVPVPCNREGLEEVPVYLLNAVLNRINEVETGAGPIVPTTLGEER